MQLVRVALDVPLPTLFDYRLEHATRDLIGARVLVPFGRGQRAGIILEVGGESEVSLERIKPVAHVFEREHRISPRRAPADAVRQPLLPLPHRAGRHGRAAAGLASHTRVARCSGARGADRQRRWPPTGRRYRPALWFGAVYSSICALTAPARPRCCAHWRSTASRAVRDLMAEGWIALEEGISRAPGRHYPSHCRARSAADLGPSQSYGRDRRDLGPIHSLAAARA